MLLTVYRGKSVDLLTNLELILVQEVIKKRRRGTYAGEFVKFTHELLLKASYVRAPRSHPLQRTKKLGRNS